MTDAFWITYALWTVTVCAPLIAAAWIALGLLARTTGGRRA